jgi:hypothetical protein
MFWTMIIVFSMITALRKCSTRSAPREEWPSTKPRLRPTYTTESPTSSKLQTQPMPLSKPKASAKRSLHKIFHKYLWYSFHIAWIASTEKPDRCIIQLTTTDHTPQIILNLFPNLKATLTAFFLVFIISYTTLIISKQQYRNTFIISKPQYRNRILSSEMKSSNFVLFLL